MYKFLVDNLATVTSLLIALTGLVGSVFGAKKWIKSQQSSDRSAAWTENVELRKEMRSENIELKSDNKELRSAIERLENALATANTELARIRDHTARTIGGSNGKPEQNRGT